MVFLSACSVTCYKGMIEEEIPRDWAKQLFSDIGWLVYEKLSKPLIFLSKLKYRGPQRQLEGFIRMLCRFPFSQDKNGYTYKVWSDTVGAFLGPILAIALMKIFGGDYKLVFWFATIPGLISVFILVSGVKEEVNRTEKSYVTKLRFKDVKVFHTNFWIVAIAGAIFQLARFSEAFLILRAKDLGLAAEFTPAVLIIMNIVYSLSAYPIGLLSDKFSREKFLMFGMLILCISDFVLGFTNHFAGAVLGIALWGLHLGFTQGTLAALIADTCPLERKGTAYGIFNLFSAISLLFASVIAGFAWDRLGSSSTVKAQ
tara:strand:- start:31 stop:972 length:942 start_codon:yes stop_codon:yes gene_type:complete